MGAPPRRSARDQPHADHREAVAVEIAGVAHRHADDLAVVARRRRASGGRVARSSAGRRQRGVDARRAPALIALAPGVKGSRASK